MDEEAIEVRPYHALQCTGDGRCDADAPDEAQIECQNERASRSTPVGFNPNTDGASMMA
jgi:hypothetical protein